MNLTTLEVISYLIAALSAVAIWQLLDPNSLLSRLVDGGKR